MKEHNKEQLQKAIAQLPTYEAPGFIWSNIESVLIEQEQEDQISKVIPELPVLEAPASIWEGIETALAVNPVEPKRKGVVISLARLAVAASFLGFAIWLGWSQFGAPNESYTLVYSEEEVGQFAYDLGMEDDEAAFTSMLFEFETSVVAQQHEDYEALLDEYEELNSAKEELKVMIDNYGTDPDIVEQISELEYERSRVIKIMAALI